MECGSHQSLTKRFEYDPETGALFNNHGRLLRSKSVTICGKSIDKHRLIWFLQTERWPTEVDHEDRNNANNRWLNLREANHAENQQNKLYTNNKSGFKGVSCHHGEWRARLGFDHIGYWEDIEMAAAAAIQARWDSHGRFARYN